MYVNKDYLKDCLSVPDVVDRLINVNIQSTRKQ